MCQPSCQALGAQPTWFCPYEAPRLSGETRRHTRHMPPHPPLMAQGKEAMGRAHLEGPEKASARKSPPGEIEEEESGQRGTMLAKTQSGDRAWHFGKLKPNSHG